MTRRVVLVCQRGNNVPFVFEAAARNDIALTVVVSPDEKQPVGMPAVAEFVTAPVFDRPDEALEIIAEHHGRRPFDGILTQREEAMVWTARAARLLGLPGISVEAAVAARDKAEMRRRFREAGLNTPRFTKIRGLQDLDALGEVELPIVVKPATAFASAGVTLCRTKEELREAVRVNEAMNAAEYSRFSRLGEEDFSGIVLEGFIDGPEFLAECFARDGRQYVLTVGYKGNPRGPYFEETVYRTPPLIEPSLIEAIAAEARGGMAALGLLDGPGHCELRVGPDGKPTILEIGARLGGSGTSGAVVEMSTGIDYAGLQFDFVTGVKDLKPLPDKPVPAHAASNYIIPLGGSGTLAGVEGLDKLDRHPDFRRLLRFLPDGTKVAPYPKFDGFIGFILGQHRDATAAEAFHRWLAETVRPVWN